MQRLLYISHAAEEFDEEEALNELGEYAIQRNKQNDLTGALFMLGGYFMQLLEGPEDALAETFTRIKADPRHSDVEVLFLEEVADRIFPDWNMSSNRIDFDATWPDVNLIVDSLRQDIEARRITDCNTAMEYFFAPNFAR